MKAYRMILVVLLAVLLVASLGVNLYEFGRVSDLSSQVNSQWSKVRLGYVVINGTAFNEANSNTTYGFGYTGRTTFRLSDVTYVLRAGCPGCNGSQSFVFKVTYQGTGSQGSWNATLGIPIFVDGVHNLPRAAFTSGTNPIVGVIWSRDGYFYFLVSVP
ncbi:MAG: hypothetical protein ABSB26_01375 [Nitrososphaerales archaeon]|jgi:hypothetical protein